MWERFLNSEISVCVTRDNVDRFLELCDSHEVRWNAGQRPAAFHPFGKGDVTYDGYARASKVYLSIHKGGGMRRSLGPLHDLETVSADELISHAGPDVIDGAELFSILGAS